MVDESGSVGRVLSGEGQPWWGRLAVQLGALAVLAAVIWTSHLENLASDEHHNEQMLQCLENAYPVPGSNFEPESGSDTF